MDMQDEKRLKQETLRAYFDNPSTYTQQLDGAGTYRLTLDTVKREIVLETPRDGTFNDKPVLKNVDVDNGDDESTYLTTIEVGDLPEVSYSLAYSIFLGMNGGQTYQAALDKAVEAFRAVIARREHMSPEQVAGLWGELEVLDHLIDTIGVIPALQTWLGPQGEEHDFGLSSVDLEVKTTTGAKRRHVISGLDQLKPREGQDLWIVSLQVTRVGQGPGESLSERCLRILDKVGNHRGELKRALQNVGWSIDDHALYVDRLALLNAPRAYPVDGHFPALTSAVLGGVVPGLSLIDDVKYRVDVSALPYGLPCRELIGLVEVTK